MIRRCDDSELEKICSIINDAAEAYKGVIPADCWKEPYISITTYCPGTGKFCFTGSDSQGKHIPTEKLKECDNNDICEGSRTAAYFYLGDLGESIPSAGTTRPPGMDTI